MNENMAIGVSEESVSVKCPKCGARLCQEVLTVYLDGSRKIKIYCPKCGYKKIRIEAKNIACSKS